MAILLLLLLIQTTLTELAYLLMTYYCTPLEEPVLHSTTVTPSSEVPGC
jgi:hypothetical protein